MATVSTVAIVFEPKSTLDGLVPDLPGLYRFD